MQLTNIEKISIQEAKEVLVYAGNDVAYVRRMIDSAWQRFSNTNDTWLNSIDELLANPTLSDGQELIVMGGYDDEEGEVFPAQLAKWAVRKEMELPDCLATLINYKQPTTDQRQASKAMFDKLWHIMVKDGKPVGQDVFRMEARKIWTGSSPTALENMYSVLHTLYWLDHGIRPDEITPSFLSRPRK